MVNGCSSLKRENLKCYVYMLLLYAHKHKLKHIYIVLGKREIYKSYEKFDSTFFLTGKILFIHDVNRFVSVSTACVCECVYELHVCISFAHEIRNTTISKPLGQFGKITVVNKKDDEQFWKEWKKFAANIYSYCINDTTHTHTFTYKCTAHTHSHTKSSNFNFEMRIN